MSVIFFPGKGFPAGSEMVKNNDTGDTEKVTFSQQEEFISVTDKNPDYKSKTFIKLSIKIIEIKSSKSILKSELAIKVIDGEEGSVRIGSGPPVKKPINYKSKIKREMMVINISPKIIKDKGIRLSIKTSYFVTDDAYAKFNNRKDQSQSANSSSDVLTANLEEVMIDLLENKKKKSKIVMKVTPFIETISGAKVYPGIVKFKLMTPILIMNDELIYKNTSSPDFMSGVSSDKTIKSSCFIECIVRKKNTGSFLLSVKPFKGLKKVGVVNNKIMKFRFEKDKFELISLEQILPLEGKWIIYGMHIPVKKFGGDPLDRNPFIKGKGGVYVLCVGDVEEYLKDLL